MTFELDAEQNAFVVSDLDRGQVAFSSAFVDLGFWLILRWQDEQGCRFVALARDGFNLEQWRALKVWLYWYAAERRSAGNQSLEAEESLTE